MPAKLSIGLLAACGATALLAAAAVAAIPAPRQAPPQTPGVQRVAYQPVSAGREGRQEVTPEACARFGYRIGGRDDDYGNRRYQALGAPPPPPPPPLAIQAAPRAERKAADASAMARPAPAQGMIMAPSSPYPYGPPPGTVETERYPGAASNPIRQVAAEPVSTFSIDVDTAAYSNVRRFLNDGVRPPKDAVRVEELINYFDYGYAAPRGRDEPFLAYTAVVPSPWASGKQIVHIGLQGYDIPRSEAPPLNLVLLVDTSGSMSGPDRLPLAIRALDGLIDQMRPGDSVAIVAYAGSAGAVLAPTGGREKLKIRCALGALHAGGSTAGGQGLALAYSLAESNFRKDSVNRVVLLTDGDFNVGVADPAKLKDFVADKRRTGIYLSVYGFGRGNYNDTMMQTLAQNGNGTAAYIDSEGEARRAFGEDLAGNVFPIADDVKIQVEFNPAGVSEYRLIGYETRMLAAEDFNNDRVDAGEVGSGVSVTALYEITPVGGAASVDPLRYQSAPRRAASSGELAYLKIRYKLPGGAASKLIEQPIGDRSAFASLEAAPEQTRWAVGVAAFGQTLRGDPWLSPDFGWDRIAALAEGARGRDPTGQRAEFITLVGRAKTGRRVNE